MSRIPVRKLNDSLKLANYDKGSADAILTHSCCNQKYPYVNIHDKNQSRYESLVEWLYSNVNDGDWIFVLGAIFFTHEEDAVTFKLVWHDT
jgi:hypothetical protein